MFRTPSCKRVNYSGGLNLYGCDDRGMGQLLKLPLSHTLPNTCCLAGDLEV